MLVGDLLQPLLGPADVVRAGLAVLLGVLQVVNRVTADVARGDAALLREVPHLLHQLLAPFLGQLGDRQADHLPVVVRGQAQVGLEDALLDVAHDALVKRRDRQQPRLRHADRRHLVYRHLRPVRIHLHAVEQGRGRTARADRRELMPRVLDRLVHPPAGVVDHVVDHGVTCTGRPPGTLLMMVPSRSPRATRAMLCSSSRLNTYSGRLLSMHRERAVVSITFSPFSIASMCVSCGISRAFGFVRGSASSTPSTPFFPIRIASAPISSARSAAAVSVVKNGLPVPAAKITIRPFSRWRIARRRMYGSATSETSIADITRVNTPTRSSASWTVSAFSTVASMPA